MFKGIDVSNNNGAVAFSEAKREGVAFVYSKVSEGIGFIDRTYEGNRVACARDGLKFGAYHFARPGQGTGRAQAQRFLAVAKVKPGDLIPTLDFEADDGIGSTKALAQYVREFSEEVKHQLGVYPLLYTYPAFRPDVLRYLAYTKLWLAKPASWLRIPGAWHQWVIWQNASHTLAVAGKGIDFDQAPSLDAITYKGRVKHPKPPHVRKQHKPVDPIVVVRGPEGGVIVRKERFSKAKNSLAKLIVRFGKVTVSK